MKITILGCGSSGGVPLISNDWGACDKNDPRNIRLRPSILVEEGGTTLLVDTTPDLRQQLLTHPIADLTAILYTHSHADHTHGIDDIRGLNWAFKKPFPLYADEATMGELRKRFEYIFLNPTGPNQFYKPSIVPHIIDGDLFFDTIQVKSFVQNHGPINSLGFRFNDFAYSTDVKRLDEAAFDILKGVKVWVVDAIREREHPTHSHLEQTLEWIARVKPERAYLTHMDQNADYATWAAKLPKGVLPAHDGLVIEC